MRHIFRFFILFLVLNFWANSSIALEEIVITGERIENPDLSNFNEMARLAEQQAFFELLESLGQENVLVEVDLIDGELEPCSDPVNGEKSIEITVKITFSEAYGGELLASENSYREIAEKAQKQHGGGVSYNAEEGLVITVVGKTSVPGVGLFQTLSIIGDSSKSLYQNIMEQYNFEPEADELEEFACKAPTSA